MRFLGIIPARYESVRFPGKPLALIFGKPMIQWVYEASVKVLDRVVVATDNPLIFDTVRSFGGRVVYTSSDHKSGTDRCAEAARILMASENFDVVINIQGDEPFIEPEQIRQLMQCFTPGVRIATLARKIVQNGDIFDPNKPKVVINKNNDALFFSRNPIPYIKGVDPKQWIRHSNFYAHVGIYGYEKDALQEITRLPGSSLEMAESLEQLRWLQNGFSIRVAETPYSSFGIDTPEDLERASREFKSIIGPQ